MWKKPEKVVLEGIFACLFVCSLAYLFPAFVFCCSPMTLVRRKGKRGINIWKARKGSPRNGHAQKRSSVADKEKQKGDIKMHGSYVEV